MRRAVSIAGWLSAVAVALVHAQQTARFRSSIDTVEVHVTVRAPDGTFMRGLTKGDFEILDNGRRRETTVFSTDVQTITLALLVDRSASVDEKWSELTVAAEAFVGALHADDRAAFSTLSWDCLPFTRDKAELSRMLRSQVQHDVASPVWHAASRMIDRLAHEGGRRALLLLSDGEDYARSLGHLASRYQGPCKYAGHDGTVMPLEDVIAQAERTGVMVYTVTVDLAGLSTRDAELRRLARESGGERYRLSQESELAPAFRRIVDELHHQYLLGFVPDAFDGQRHTIDVRVARLGVTVRARRSYVATRARD
jgi:VWFA-related protein